VTPPDLSGYLTATQLAHRLNLSRRVIYYWIQKGAIVTVLVAGHRLIPPAEVSACLPSDTAQRSNLDGTHLRSAC
jgi:excisionase family DNA binding protein